VSPPAGLGALPAPWAHRRPCGRLCRRRPGRNLRPGRRRYSQLI